MESIASCGLCAFFLPQQGYEGGRCRRFPPVVNVYITGRDGDVSSDPVTEQPYVQKDDACGEFKMSVR